MQEKITHTQAQRGAITLVRWYLQSGRTWNEAKEMGLASTDCYVHLKHCWKSDEPNEKCEILRSLVDAIQRDEDLSILYPEVLTSLGINPKQSRHQNHQGAHSVCV